MMFFLALLIYMGIMTLVGTTLMNNSYLKLLRVFFPSWRFFEAVTPIPKISYRLIQANQFKPEWQDLPVHSKPRLWRQLWHNPQGNLYLHYQSRVEQLINDIATRSEEQSARDVTQSGSYQIIRSYIEEELQQYHPEGFQDFEFKIGVLEFSQIGQNGEPRSMDSVIFQIGEPS